MITQHLLSTCCVAKIIHYGDRRRQCVQCKKTWRLYQHKKGRNSTRLNSSLIKRVILNGQKIKEQKRNFSNLSVQSIEKRFQKSLDYYSQQELQLPKRLNGKYTLLGDGIWYNFDGEDWVQYVLLLKPRRRNYAYLLEPIILKGKESFDNWRTAIDNAASDLLKKHIFAFVSDNFRASDKIVWHYDWQHQLCHFHLIKELQKRRCKRKFNTPNRSIRESIYLIIRQLLKGKPGQESKSFITILLRLAGHRDCPKKLGMIARQFLKDINKYKTYQLFPKYTIPHTNNVSESLANLVRKRTSKLNNPDSVIKWTKIYIRLKRTMNCNGNH